MATHPRCPLLATGLALTIGLTGALTSGSAALAASPAAAAAGSVRSHGTTNSADLTPPTIVRLAPGALGEWEVVFHGRPNTGVIRVGEDGAFAGRFGKTGADGTLVSTIPRGLVGTIRIVTEDGSGQSRPLQIPVPTSDADRVSPEPRDITVTPTAAGFRLSGASGLDVVNVFGQATGALRFPLGTVPVTDGRFAVEVPASLAGRTIGVGAQLAGWRTAVTQVRVPDDGRGGPSTPNVRIIAPSKGVTVLAGDADPGTTIVIRTTDGDRDLTTSRDGSWSGEVTNDNGGVRLLARDASGAFSPEVTVPLGAAHVSDPSGAAVVRDGADVRITGAASGDRVGLTGTGRTEVSAPIIDGTFTVTVPAATLGTRVSIASHAGSSTSGALTVTIPDATSVGAPSVSRTIATATGKLVLIGTATGAVSVSATIDGSHYVFARVSEGRFSVELPSEVIGRSIGLTGIGDDGSRSATTTTTLELPSESAEVGAPVASRFFEHVDGTRSFRPVPSGDEPEVVWLMDGRRQVVRAALVERGSSVVTVWDIAAEAANEEYTIVAFDGAHRSAPVVVPGQLSVDGIANSNRYTPGPRTFTGTATPGSVIVARDAGAGELFRTTVGASRSASGTWSAVAELAKPDGYDVSFTQTTPTGGVSVMEHVAFVAEADTRPFAVTSHTNGQTYTAGKNTFTGTATAGSLVTAKNQWGTPMGSAKTNATGTWTFDRDLGPTADYTVTFTTDSGQNPLTLHLNGPKSNAPFAVTSHTNGQTYTAGKNTFTGTATAGSLVTAKNQWGTPMGSAKTNATGTWTFDRDLGPTADYTVTFTTDSGQNPLTLHLNGPKR
ncbi:hypothetical protein [Curtobacterium sp. ZW137]|uniref:hypothetical protein n=1 Tax=Curtobacterium sp. ZW137 TaxID=2485104 RepID=UPI000FBC3D5D|nr:hypothetical protein [Curtobacterium sp. ZW137]ROP65925.1 hypothetical protein EDF55_0369 [Curtobacterium sp. ZW137]